MSDYQYFSRMIITVVLSVYAVVSTLLLFLVNYLKNPFENPFANKLRLLPPTIFAHPKFGVHQYVKLNNTRIHYMESGDSSKPLIIFLHGFPEFWYSWRHQIVEFQKDYWCVAVDLRGFGDSEKTEGVSYYKLDVLVEDLKCLVDHLGSKKCILVSHDFGGMVACRFRETYPERVGAVILLASSSIEALFTHIWNSWGQLIRSWHIFMFNLPWIPERWMLLNNLGFLEQLMPHSTNKNITLDDVECYKYWTGKPFLQTIALNCFRANFMLNCPKKEKEVKSNIPMFAIYASDDKFLETDLLKILKKEYSNIESTILDNVGHCIQQEEPEKVNSLIKDFLAKHHVC